MARIAFPYLHRLRIKMWRNPDLLYSTKVTVAMAVLVIPLVALGYPYFGSTLALGVVAGGLAETDDHPKGRIKALLLTWGGFLITTFSVVLLRPYPIIFGVGFVLATITFVLIGGMSERYRGISYGAILVSIYAMLGMHYSPEWYWEPILLVAGAVIYGIFSLILLYFKPTRLLDERLARGYLALADYLDAKAKLFPSDGQEENVVGGHLAILNVQVVNLLEKCKEVLNSYGEEVNDPKVLMPYLQRFMLLQSLHERAASSQERYEKLGKKIEYKEILEGFGELLHQLAHACRLASKNLLTGERYNHPVSIGWLVSALEFEIDKMAEEDKQLLILLFHNLTRSHQSLEHFNEPEKSTSPPRLRQDTRTLFQRIKDQLSFQHPRLRYAIRLSTCFLVGYIIATYFQIEKGEWIVLTALFVNQPTYSETRKRLFQRVMGTMAGVVIGVSVIQILPTDSGQVIMLLASAFWFFFYRQANYAFAVVFITIYVLSSNNLITDSGIAVMFPRMLDTILGATLAILSIRVLWPDWQYRRLPGLLSSALRKNAEYFSTVVKAHKPNEGVDDYDYRVARREAHKADNQLTLSWQSMRLEPRKQRFMMEQAFTLTYLNHALVSYISAFGARRDTDPLIVDGYNELAVQINEALNRAADIIEGKEDVDKHSLKEMLMTMRDRIDDLNNEKKRQQLRLFYNIAGVSNKLLKQARSMSEKE
ncbi:YccS family putative transporter [Carboxylicivirga linearis]|uniref:TIGR01666 family membrane protein n=1 Tax=Carboxylicivirga linearis TaxID=1628157 RepID=A0ABS5JV70_9BACT|nr:YccS family putative transporter [Carboxylicivirga linearis]MBS2098772.1 TIGR01666 family membrane protein [Carboxylicivirga linearis]